MPKRNSRVKKLFIDVLDSGSVLEIGDSVHIDLFTDALAVQRGKEVFWENEGNFQHYDAFNRPIPFLPLPHLPFMKQTYHQCRNIYVGNIDITSLSASAVTQVGTARRIQSEARVLHIRQLEFDMSDSEE